MKEVKQIINYSHHNFNTKHFRLKCVWQKMFLTCCIILSDHTIFLIAKFNVSWQSYCINGLTSSFLLELPHNRTRFAILRGSAPYIIKSGPRYNKKNLLNELFRKVVSEESWQSYPWRRWSGSSCPRTFLSP